MTDIVGKIESAKITDVRNQLEYQWSSLLNDPATRQIAERRGIDLDALEDLRGQFPFDVLPATDGNRSDVMTAILIGIAIGVGTDVAKAALYEAWNKVIKPSLTGVRDATLDDDKGAKLTKTD